MENASFTLALVIVLGAYAALLTVLSLNKRIREWFEKLRESIGPDGREDEEGFHRGRKK